jgi:hypothetical protein
LGRWVIAGPILCAAIVACVSGGCRLAGPQRALLLGLAAGISFGVSAALTKTFVHLLSGGVLSMLQNWEPYALAVTSTTGFVLMQSSFQAGSLSASVAALEVAEPFAAAALGIGLFDEGVQLHGIADRLSIAVALAAMLYGVIMLSRSTTELVPQHAGRVRRLDEHDGDGVTSVRRRSRRG